MELLIKGILAAVAVVLAVLVWRAHQPPCAFLVRITGGIPRVARGRVTPEFLREIGAACRLHGVSRGAVRGLVRGHRIALAFSGGFPRPCQQQLRNVWAQSGWPAAPGRGGPGRPEGPGARCR